MHRCDHIGILTNDAQRLIRFYTDKLDFKKIKEDILDASTFGTLFGFRASSRFIRLSTDGLMLELFEPMEKKASPNTVSSTGLNHFGYCVKNRLNYVKRLRKKKVNIIEIERNAHKVYFVSDPDGNRIKDHLVIGGEVCLGIPVDETGFALAALSESRIVLQEARFLDGVDSYRRFSSGILSATARGQENERRANTHVLSIPFKPK